MTNTPSCPEFSLLSQFLDGDLEKSQAHQLSRHVGSCQYCRAQIRDLEHAQEWERSALSAVQNPVSQSTSSTSCLSSETLFAYAQDSLSPTDERTVDAHILACGVCLSEVREVMRAAADLATVNLQSVPAELKEKAPDSAVVSVVKRVLRPGGAADKIKVRGTDDVMVFRAKCCNPIRGEKIVGYITRGKGVSVHSASCTNVLNLMFDPERRIDVEWDQAGGDAPYIVRLTMQVEDRKGMLAEISAKVSDINTNITNMQARTGEDQQARIDMTVEIRDLKHLDKVIKSIKGVQGVIGVERTARA